MSTDPTVDQTLLEQTRIQIRNIVGEITQLAKLDVAPEEFHAEILPRIVTALAAIGGAIWTADERGALSLGFQVNMQALGLHTSEEANKKHSRLLYKQLQSKDDEPVLVMPHSGGEGPDEPGNPTDALLIFCPIRTELEVVGLLEIAKKAESSPVAQKGYAKFLGQMGLLIADYYKNRQLRNFNERQTLWTLLEEFTRTIHKTLELRETAYTVVNEGRRLIECDRVSIALKRGGKCVIESVSGQDMVDKRSTTVKLLGKLATAVVRCNEPIWYTGDTSDFAPQVEKAVENYVDESHTKMVAVFPLTKKRLEEAAEEDLKAREKPLAPFGALIIEQIEDSRIPERMKKRVEIVADHACSALNNSLDHNNVFLMPLWRLIGKSKILVTARMLPKTVSISLAIIALICVMIFVPWDFNMQCPGSLEPVNKRYVYAAVSGNVENVFCDHGDFVQAGDVLVVCRNTELEQKLTQSLGEANVLSQRFDSLTKEQQNPRTEPSKKQELFVQIEQVKEEIKTNQEMRELLLTQMEDLKIKAPISGMVITLDVRKNLMSRPVTPGASLLEIADMDRHKPWKLELDMPEKRMGYVIDYQKSLLAENPNERLDVDFVLASNPDIRYKARVETIHNRAEVRGEAGAAGGGNTVRIKAELLDQTDLPDSLLPGAGCQAKVKCGRQPVGFVLFHEALDYVQKNIIFRFF
ncbi:MAG: hypothetical protein ACRC10_07060 [Thermoguttaceae bacterium]